MKDDYSLTITSVDAELAISALQFFKGRLEYADGRCDNTAHRESAKFTKRRIDELVGKIADATGVNPDVVKGS